MQRKIILIKWVLTVALLLGLSTLTIGDAQAKQKGPLPKSYGVYLVSEGKLMELKPKKTTLVYPYKYYEPYMIARESLPQVTIKDRSPEIILYGKKYSSLLKFPEGKLLEGLVRFKYRYAGELWKPSPEHLTKWVRINKGMWASLAKDVVRLEISPVEGKDDMYRLTSTTPLTPGVYGIIAEAVKPFQGPRFACFAVNYRKIQHLAFKPDSSRIPEDRNPLAILKKTATVMKNRLLLYRVRDVFIYRTNDRIIVQVPSTVEGSRFYEKTQRVIDLLGKTALLEFKLLDEKGDLGEALKGNIPPGDELLYDSEGKAYLVKKGTLLTGRAIKDAHVEIGSFEQPYVALKFTPEGAKKFADITGRYINERLAIILDNVVKSAPVIKTRITAGKAVIEGDFTKKEAKNIATVIKFGPLPVPTNIIEKTTVVGEFDLTSFNEGYLVRLKCEEYRHVSMEDLKKALKGMKECLVQNYPDPKRKEYGYSYLIWAKKELGRDVDEAGSKITKALQNYYQGKIGFEIVLTPAEKIEGNIEELRKKLNPLKKLINYLSDLF